VILNRVEREAPPAYDVAEGLAALEDPPVVEQFLREVQRRMTDPASEQLYFQRGDNGKMVKTQAEYARCVRKGVPLRTVPQAVAAEVLREEDAARSARHEKKLRRKGRA